MEKVIRKFLIAFLAAICLTSIALAAACSKEPKYYVLTFVEAEGIEYVCDIPSGYEVKDGAEVSFTLSLAENVIGEPSVYANETLIEADGNGVYKFIMKEETAVTVSDTYLLREYKVSFDAGDNMITFLNESDEKVETVYADEGTVVKFKINVSVYHDRTQEFDVLANSVLLKPADGIYSFTVTSDTRVSVSGLEIAEGFTSRENSGSGTKDDPFLISEPVDLYYMRELINDGFYSGYYGNAYYKLVKDLDFEGEQVYVLGDSTISGQLELQSYFSGSFDGNGHTMSNFYITEEQLDVEHNRYLIPYIGLFGLAIATTERPVEIKNLTLKNFTLTVDAAQEGGFTFYAGGLVGYGMGVNITNCTVEGSITVIGPQASDTNIKVGYVGGIAGSLESVYLSEDVKFNSTIVACGTDAAIVGESGVIFAAGGLVGSLVSSDDKANSYILNSYAKNNVSGAVYTGGLVGSLSAYSSVSNSYFTGNYVEAYSRVPNSASFMAYAHSYSGGIAGYMNFDSVVSDCFSSATVNAGSASGNNFAHKGEITGYTEGAGQYLVEGNAALIVNSHFNSNSSTLNKQYALSTLGWVEGDWNFEGSLPVPAGAPSAEFVLTIDYNGNSVNGGDTKTYTLSGNRNMSQLYADGTIEQFVKSGSLMSYGYYFDKACTEKVTFGYVPSGDVTLYADFANYNEVAGRYYLSGDSVYLDLNVDGTLIYRNGALSHTSYYTYDGTNVILMESAAFMVVERVQVDSENYYDVSLYFCAVGTADANGNLSLVNISSGYNGSAVQELSSYYTSASPLKAVKQLDNFVYGDYYGGTVQYSFYPDGTGVYGNVSFIYTVSGNTITTNIGSGLSTGVIDNGYVVSLGSVSLSKYDSFKGVWENSASSHKQYEFDGKGGYVYEYYEYVTGSDEKTTVSVIETESGSYTINEGVLTLENGVEFSFDENGYLAVSFGTYNQTYYKENSFTGEWKFFNTDEAIDITFNGISVYGYGTGTIVYGQETYVADFEYETVNVTEGEDSYVDMYIYTQDSLIGVLRYTVEDNTLRGSIYSVYYGFARSAIFCMYDDFRGLWISSELGLIEFNGLGNYNLGGGSTGIIKTIGEVIVNGEYAGTYVLEGYNLKGTFTCNGLTYAIEYDEATGTIKVTESDNDFSLVGVDHLYGITFVTEDGDKLAFNGGGYVTGGGILTKNGESLYSYIINSDGEIEIYGLDGEEKLGGVSVSENVFVLTAEGTTVKFTYDNAFTGSWVVGGAEDGILVIGLIGADKTASGSFLGNNVTFLYDLENDVLTFSNENGEELNVYSFTALGKTELKVGSSYYDANALICVTEENVGPLKGVYTASDDKSIYIDGMNASTFGKGTAVVYNGDAVEKYTYKLDGDNIVLTGSATYILKAVPTETLGAYVKGDNAYFMLVPDEMYDVRVSDAKKTTYYRFDGTGTVTATGTKTVVYTYSIDEIDDVARVYTLTLTDEEGNVFEAVYDFTGTAVITVTEKTSDEE